MPPRTRLDYILLGVILTAGFLARLVALLWFPGLHHPDEDFQMLEQAHRFTFGYGVIPWEFEAGIRSPLPPLLLSWLYEASRFLIGEGPHVYITFTRTVLAAMSLASVAAIFLMGLRRSRTHAIIGGVVGASWFELVYFSFRTMPEAISLNLLLIVLSMTTYRQTALRRQELVAAGFCLAAAVMVRLQFAPAIAIVAMYVSILNPRDNWRPMLMGASVPILAFGAADWIAWGAPFFSQFATVRANLFEGVASTFGVQPFGWYFSGALERYSWVAAVLGCLVLFSDKNLRLWVIVGITIIAAHLAIPHKEYRFVFPGFVCLTIAAAMTSAELCRRWTASAGPVKARILSGSVAVVWMATSLYLAFAPGYAFYWTKYREYVKAALWLADRSDVCGVLIYDQPTVGYSFLHHNVPVYMSRYNHLNVTVPNEPIAVPDWNAFNFIELHRRVLSRFPPDFQLAHCVGNHDPLDACILRRDGKCLPTTKMVPLLAQRAFGRAPDSVHNIHNGL